MAKQNQTPTAVRQAPGPGLSTADAAFDDLRKDIAQRNERVHTEARKSRVRRDQEYLRIRRERDL